MRIAPSIAVIAALAATLPAQLAGPYTVGPGGNYANIAAAISALTTNGVSGPCSFLVTANDTGPWTLGAITGQGPTNPILFDGNGTVTLSGTPLLTLNGCANVTFRGFNGTFTTANHFVITGTTTDCVFTRCNFLATAATTPTTAALFNCTGGTNCRIEDSTFGGAYEAIFVQTACTGLTIQRCTIVGGGWWIMRVQGPNTTIENNFITGNSNYGISCGTAATNGVNLKIRNNSFYITHASTGAQYDSLRWYSNAAGTEVLNNIFYNVWVGSPGNTMWCSGTNRPTVMNYNCLFSSVPTYTPITASGAQTFASWQALGFDVNSINVDPMYVAPGATPADLRLMTGSPCSTAGTTLAPIVTDHFQVLRSTPYSIGAYEDVGGLGASYAVFGGGCAGHAGVPSNISAGTPTLGTTSVLTLGNLPPPNVAIIVFGFSNTISGIGPLPVQLTVFGAPGCSARVSLDATAFLVGAGGSASYTLNTPNNPLFIAMQLHTQGLVLDPGINALGAVTSDAATATVGL